MRSGQSGTSSWWHALHSSAVETWTAPLLVEVDSWHALHSSAVATWTSPLLVEVDSWHALHGSAVETWTTFCDEVA